MYRTLTKKALNGRTTRDTKVKNTEIYKVESLILREDKRMDAVVNNGKETVIIPAEILPILLIRKTIGVIYTEDKRGKIQMIGAAINPIISYSGDFSDIEAFGEAHYKLNAKCEPLPIDTIYVGIMVTIACDKGTHYGIPLKRPADTDRARREVGLDNLYLGSGEYLYKSPGSVFVDVANLIKV